MNLDELRNYAMLLNAQQANYIPRYQYAGRSKSSGIGQEEDVYAPKGINMEQMFPGADVENTEDVENTNVVDTYSQFLRSLNRVPSIQPLTGSTTVPIGVAQPAPIYPDDSQYRTKSSFLPIADEYARQIKGMNPELNMQQNYSSLVTTPQSTITVPSVPLAGNTVTQGQGGMDETSYVDKRGNLIGNRDDRKNRFERKDASKPYSYQEDPFLQQEYQKYLDFRERNAPAEGYNTTEIQSYEDFISENYSDYLKDKIGDGAGGGDDKASFYDMLMAVQGAYGNRGYGLDQSLYTLGTYLGKEKDTRGRGLGIGLSAATSALKGASNVLAGLGYQRATNQAKDWYDRQMKQMSEEYYPIDQTATGYLGDIAVNAYGGRFEQGGKMDDIDISKDERFKPGQYVEFEYGGKMYKGTIKSNNGKKITLK